MGLRLALIFNYLFKVAKTSASRVFALKDCVKGMGTTTASTGLFEYFFGKWTLYFLPKLPIGKPEIGAVWPVVQRYWVLPYLTTSLTLYQYWAPLVIEKV